MNNESQPVPSEDPPAYSALPSSPYYDYSQQQFHQPQASQSENYKLTTGGYQPIPGSTYPPIHQYQQVVTTPIASQSIIIIGGCPACRVGVLEDDFSCLAICCAIAFFPIGLLCCLALKEKRCTNCGAVFG